MSTYPIPGEAHRARLLSWHATRVEWLVAIAFLVIGLHLLFDALTRGRPAGVTALELVGGLVLAPALFELFLRAARLWRVVIAGLAGIAALSLGIEAYAVGAFMAGRRASDVTGIAMALAGVVLIGLALRLALAGRRRWVQAIVGLAVGIVLAQLVLVPAVNVGVVTHSPREAIPSAVTLGLPGARDVTFTAPDGVTLSGWYVPGRNRAAVILLHGSHGDRTSTEDHLRFLSRAGYGVLTFDARGHGESGGHTNALGWRADEDVGGAVAFLNRQGLDANRIGITGFCWGGRIVWLYAAHSTAVKAGVAWYGRLVGDKDPLRPHHPIDVAAALKAPVLGLYGGQDQGIPVATVEEMRKALAAGGAASKRSQLHVYPDAGHAFFADYRPSYKPADAADGWSRLLAWFKSNGVV